MTTLRNQSSSQEYSCDHSRQSKPAGKDCSHPATQHGEAESAGATVPGGVGSARRAAPDCGEGRIREVTRLAILGSTGSIGTQTLDIVRDNRDKFVVVVLTAGRNAQLAIAQAIEFQSKLVVMADEEAYLRVRQGLAGMGIEVAYGADEIARAAAFPGVDMVVTALVGYSGLRPTLAAIAAGRVIALANKETLVAGGELVDKALRDSESYILPVDSEHSAIFQCLVGENRARMSRIILTASGGPFRTLLMEELENVTVEQALNNPNWDMGAKVTIDSASMMNKGFEMIEACRLFAATPEEISIVVHPQSVVHSMVEFTDGSVMAQLAVPDMHLPISYALHWPERAPIPGSRRLKLTDYGSLTFEEPDLRRFPLLQMAFDAMAEGGTAPCVLNAANEIAVEAFLKRRLRFTQMPLLVAATLERFPAKPVYSLEQLMEVNAEARRAAEELAASGDFSGIKLSYTDI